MKPKEGKDRKTEREGKIRTGRNGEEGKETEGRERREGREAKGEGKQREGRQGRESKGRKRNEWSEAKDGKRREAKGREAIPLLVAIAPHAGSGSFVGFLETTLFCQLVISGYDLNS